MLELKEIGFSVFVRERLTIVLFFSLLKLCFLMDIFSYVEAGAGEEKDNIWRAAQEKVWNARRLWMGRGVTGMAQRRLSLLVA